MKRGVVRCMLPNTTRALRGPKHFKPNHHFPSTAKMKELTAFELQRLENIRKNQELMISLGIGEVSSPLHSSFLHPVPSHLLTTSSPSHRRMHGLDRLHQLHHLQNQVNPERKEEEIPHFPNHKHQLVNPRVPQIQTRPTEKLDKTEIQSFTDLRIGESKRRRSSGHQEREVEEVKEGLQIVMMTSSRGMEKGGSVIDPITKLLLLSIKIGIQKTKMMFNLMRTGTRS